MGGLARIAKLYGGIRINGKLMVWDYANDVAVPEAEMPPGSERWKESERIRWRSRPATPQEPDDA